MGNFFSRIARYEHRNCRQNDDECEDISKEVNGEDMNETDVSQK